MHKILFTTLFLLWSTWSLLAQRPGSNANFKGLITGKVVEAASQSPLEFSTITLLSQQDSSIVGGIITDVEGNFKLETKAGKYFAKVEFIGYEVTYIDDIIINRKNPTLDIGTINVSADAAVIEEIEVVGEKSTFQMSLDKKVFNVGKDLTSTGANAAEILDNVPSVTVDVQGNIELRGSGNVRILINGKPSAMVGIGDTDGLKNLNGDAIERIEVITNPSARYDAEGMSGIINIILKEPRAAGLNGSFTVNAGTPSSYGTSFNLNYRKNNFNFFTNVGIAYRTYEGGGSVYQENRTDSLLLLTDQTRDHTRTGLSGNFRFGANYFFSEKSILTTSFNYRKSKDDNDILIEYFDYVNNLDNPTGINSRAEEEKEDDETLQYEISYKKTFDRKGHELNLNVNYQDSGETENSDFREQLLNPDRSPKDLADILQRSENEEGEKRMMISADYILPVQQEGKIELGMRTTITEINNDFRVQEQNDAAEWVNNPNLTNNFIYDENVYALYAIYGNKIKKFSYQLGLRTELSDVKTLLKTTEEENDRNYNNFFPSAHISYNLTSGDAIQLSYSRRIRRPRFWDLNPFFTYSDSRNFYSGNPNLNPEFTDAYELGYMKIFKSGSLGSSLYYRHTSDVIQRLLFVGDNGTTIRRPENLATEDNYGLEFNGSWQATKKARINGNLNFFRSVTEGSTPTQDLSADTYTWSGRLSSKYEMPLDIDLQLNYYVRGARKTTQGKRDAVQSLSLALGRDILNKNGTITLNVSDLFNSRKWRTTLESEHLYMENEFQWSGRRVMLNFTYRLNQKKSRGGQRGNYDGGGEGEF